VFSSRTRVVSSGKFAKWGTQASVIQVHPMLRYFRPFEFFRDYRSPSVMKACPNRLKCISELQFSKLLNGRLDPWIFSIAWSMMNTSAFGTFWINDPLISVHSFIEKFFNFDIGLLVSFTRIYSFTPTQSYKSKVYKLPFFETRSEKKVGSKRRPRMAKDLRFWVPRIAELM